MFVIKIFIKFFVTESFYKYFFIENFFRNLLLQKIYTNFFLTDNFKLKKKIISPNILQICKIWREIIRNGLNRLTKYFFGNFFITKTFAKIVYKFFFVTISQKIFLTIL